MELLGLLFIIFLLCGFFYILYKIFFENDEINDKENNPLDTTSLENNGGATAPITNLTPAAKPPAIPPAKPAPKTTTKPPAKKPVAKPPAKKPAAKKPTSRKPAVKPASAGKSATKKPAAKKPVAKPPVKRTTKRSIPPDMDPAFMAILQRINSERGFSIFENFAKCKSLLQDYTAGEYKKENRLLLLAIEAGCPGEIARSTEPEITQKRLISKLHNEFSMDQTAAEQIVTVLYEIYGEGKMG